MLGVVGCVFIRFAKNRPRSCLRCGIGGFLKILAHIVIPQPNSFFSAGTAKSGVGISSMGVMNPGEHRVLRYVCLVESLCIF